MPRRLFSYKTPDQLTGLVAWLKADALGLSDGDAVASWTDSSGNSNTPTQGTAANKPTFTASVLNGKPVIRFDGNDGLTMPTEGNFDLATSTIFAIFKRNSGTSGTVMGKSTTGFVNAQRRKLQIATTSSGINYNSGSDSQAVGITAVPTNWNLYAIKTTGDSDHSIYLNGVQTDSALALGDSSTNNAAMIIGSNFSVGTEAFNGDIAEIIVYNRALGALEMIGIQNYLANKYNLPVSANLGGYPRSAISGRILLKEQGNAVRTNAAVGSAVTWTAAPFLVPTVVTACVWLKLRANTASIFDIPFGFGNTRWFLIFNSTTNRPGFNVKISGVEKSSGFIATPLELDKFYLLCGTYDPSGGANNLTVRVYNQAGNLVGASASTQTGNMDSSGYPLTFGRDVVRAYNMSVDGDDMRVYSRILTINEQNNLAIGIEPSTANLELLAKCDETSGNLADSSGNGRTGTNIATATFVPSFGGGARKFVGSGVVQ